MKYKLLIALLLITGAGATNCLLQQNKETARLHDRVQKVSAIKPFKSLIMYQQEQTVTPTRVPGRSVNTLIRVKGFWIAESIENEPEVGVVLMCGTPIILCSLQKFQAEYSTRPELASAVNTLATESNYYIGETAFYTDINISSSKVFCCALPEMIPTALQPLCTNFNSFK